MDWLSEPLIQGCLIFLGAFVLGWTGGALSRPAPAAPKARFRLRRPGAPHEHTWVPRSTEWTAGKKWIVRTCDKGHPRIVDRIEAEQD